MFIVLRSLVQIYQLGICDRNEVPWDTMDYGCGFLTVVYAVPLFSLADRKIAYLNQDKTTGASGIPTSGLRYPHAKEAIRLTGSISSSVTLIKWPSVAVSGTRNLANELMNRILGHLRFHSVDFSSTNSIQTHQVFVTSAFRSICWEVTPT